ncbi:MAG TPA: hypothetical protein VK154_01795 [Chitinophagales bacterium]|nr:hypothetical protein [Chitinophagales bacterium]
MNMNVPNLSLNTTNTLTPDSFLSECEKKIEKNNREIAQFKENMASIGPLLKAKFDKRVAGLEKKNASLALQMAEYKAKG